MNPLPLNQLILNIQKQKHPFLLGCITYYKAIVSCGSDKNGEDGKPLTGAGKPCSSQLSRE